MKSLHSRLIALGITLFGVASVAFALTQTVRYKPWGVPDSRRDEYDQRMVEINAQAEAREQFADQPRPIAAAIPTTHHFGPAFPGESLSYAFSLTNKGDKELTLEVRETSSERIEAALDVQTVAPGESAECVVSLTTPEELLPDVDVQTVTLRTNDPLKPVMVLTTAFSLRKEIITPKKISFGSHDITDPATTEFVVYSQRASNIQLLDVVGESFDIESAAIDEDLSTGDLADKSVTAAKRITLKMFAKDYGSYSGDLALSFDLDGAKHQASIPFKGTTRPPVGFYGPEVDIRSGIDFGTCKNDEQHDLFVVIRSRADKARHIEVLGVEPKELETELTPLETEGSYRLRVSIPKGCPDRRFNLSSQHGYVHVGDPEMKSYSGVLPVFGVVSSF
ncbi:MAG: DUF1573 domain-containing protein [Planctomycetota bacterium]